MAIALINETPYPAFGFDTELYDEKEYHSLAAKATFAITAQGLSPLEEQPPLNMADRYAGEPGASSLLQPSDLIPFRERTDVLVTGEARAPGGEPAHGWLAHVQVGALRKSLQITGPRHWRYRAMGGWELSHPSPVRGVPLLYEHAFGGEHPSGDDAPRDAWLANPVGVGFGGRLRGERGERWERDREWPAPQLLSPDETLAAAPGRHYRTLNFAPVPGDWQPRVSRIGTTDEAWRKQVAPHLPRDFDLRYFNCAPDDQQTNGYLRGDEDVELEGLFEAVRGFRLPALKATALMADHDGIVVPLDMDLSTLHIDLDQGTLALVWRLTTGAQDWSQASLSIMER
ncbi:DUF2169 domain-containing protein [Variovorax sp. UC122_21]|uniref:DUF2169 family type VI secretion system accessory protein n=1 Tax=Variovorax sp. UC122_21 TaxID=3374554 RepID=UPI00375678BC